MLLGAVVTAFIWAIGERHQRGNPPDQNSHKSAERPLAGKMLSRPADLTDMVSDFPKPGQPVVVVEGIGEVGYDAMQRGQSARDLLKKYGLENEARGVDPDKIAVDFYTEEDGTIKHVAVNRGFYPAESTSEETWKEIADTGISVSRKRLLAASMESEVFMKSLLYWMGMHGAYMSTNYMPRNEVSSVSQGRVGRGVPDKKVNLARGSPFSLASTMPRLLGIFLV
jgi:hypothetical protein